MRAFQAIDNNNNIIESIPAGGSPSLVESAAQAWYQNFPADYSSFSEEELKEEWIRQEAQSLIDQYDINSDIAYEEAMRRFNR